MIADAIARALALRLGVVSRVAKAAGLESVTIAGALKIDVSKIGKVDGVTLPDALRALAERQAVIVVTVGLELPGEPWLRRRSTSLPSLTIYESEGAISRT